MGHSWQEVRPKEAAAHYKRQARIHKLREEIEDMPLSNFIVADFGALYRVMAFKDPSDADLDRLERIVQEKS